MELALLISIFIGLSLGIAVWLLLSWTMLRRQLALEHYVKTLEDSLGARLDTLGKIKDRQDKSEAAKVRWTKKDLEDQATLKEIQETAPKFVMPQGW